MSQDERIKHAADIAERIAENGPAVGEVIWLEIERDRFGVTVCCDDHNEHFIEALTDALMLRNDDD